MERKKEWERGKRTEEEENERGTERGKEWRNRKGEEEEKGRGKRRFGSQV